MALAAVLVAHAAGAQTRIIRISAAEALSRFSAECIEDSGGQAGIHAVSAILRANDSPPAAVDSIINGLEEIALSRAVLASVWSDPSVAELAQLWSASYRVRDARLTQAVIDVLRDPSRTREVRMVAARVLASHAAPDLVVLDADLAKLRGDSLHRVYISVDHSDVREGTVPVTRAVVDEIRVALRWVAENDDDPQMREVAGAVGGQVEMHVRPI